MATDSQIAQLLQIIGKGKRFSELEELFSLTSNDFYLGLNRGDEDVKKIKIALLRGLSGDWNASTNTPTLVNGTGLGASVYRVSVAGNRDLGNGTVSYGVDDIIYYNGSKWVKLIQSQISDIEGLEDALSEKFAISQLGDSFYFDQTILRLNTSTYRQTIDYTSGGQIFTLDFEPTFFVSIFINGVYLDEDEYIYTSPNQLEILGELENGDTIKVIYEHFVNPPE